jgi:uncharacterized protein (TIGR02996 family)
VTPEAAFLADIVANPEDTAPRLIFADWIEENGGQSKRAEFIRLQVRLAAFLPDEASRQPPEFEWLKQRLCELWADFDSSWLGPGWTAPLLSGYAEATPEARQDGWRTWVEFVSGGMRTGPVVGFRRGLPERLKLSAARWLLRCDQLTAVYPIREVGLTSLPSVDCPLVPASAAAFGRSQAAPVQSGVLLSSGGAVRLLRGGRHPQAHNGPDYLRQLLSEEWPGIAFSLPTEMEAAYP